MSEEKERNKKAAKMQDSVMYEDFKAINMAINDGKFEFFLLKEIIMKWKKPFPCQVHGIDCIIGKENNPSCK